MAERKRVTTTAAQPARIEVLMREFYIANKDCNAAKAKAEKARKELYQLMKDEKKNSHVATVINSDGLPLPLIAEVGASEKNEVDIVKLRKLVGEDVFMQCVSATQSAVKDVAGENICNLTLVKKVGTENVSVSIKK